jgi:hypothetical protein
MAYKSQGTWYVPFELPRANRARRVTATETFPNEREAKIFARVKFAETQKVSAGTQPELEHPRLNSPGRPNSTKLRRLDL